VASLGVLYVYNFVSQFKGQPQAEVAWTYHRSQFTEALTLNAHGQSKL